MIKFFRIRTGILLLLFAGMMVIADGCASSHAQKKKKKLKPGKEIPCPLKDC
jgi:hypothetical protein